MSRYRELVELAGRVNAQGTLERRDGAAQRQLGRHMVDAADDLRSGRERQTMRAIDRAGPGRGVPSPVLRALA